MNWNLFFFYKDGDIFWKSRPRSDFRSDKSWKSTNANFAGKRAGAVVTSSKSATSYRQVEVFGKAFKCHRVIWEMHNGGIEKGFYIDHIDGNGLNNKIENLRLVDALRQMHNLPRQKSNKSGIVGVCWHKSAKLWQARISFDGVRYDLGRFASKTDAIKARADAQIRFNYHENHGRFA